MNELAPSTFPIPCRKLASYDSYHHRVLGDTPQEPHHSSANNSGKCNAYTKHDTPGHKPHSHAATPLVQNPDSFTASVSEPPASPGYRYRTTIQIDTIRSSSLSLQSMTVEFQGPESCWSSQPSTSSCSSASACTASPRTLPHYPGRARITSAPDVLYAAAALTRPHTVQPHPNQQPR